MLLAALLRLPQVVGTRMAVIYLPVTTVLSYLVALWLARPGPSGAVALLITYLLVGTLASILSASLAQMLAGAAAFDLGAVAGSSTPPHARWWTVRWRLGITVASVVRVRWTHDRRGVLGTGAQEQDYLLAVVVGASSGARSSGG